MKHWQHVTQDELKKYVPDPDGEIERLQEQLNYALEVMGQIAMCSDDKVDALQCANAIITIKEWGVK